jgi:membrane associated rhomboid family serine protease
MRIPAWIFAAVGIMVVVFGAWRIRLSFRTVEEDESARQRGGLYGVGRRTHLLIGIVYILLGVYLLLGAFGVRIGLGR